MKKKILISVVTFFALHALTWWVWGDEELARHGLKIIEKEADCIPDSLIGHNYNSIVYAAEFLEENSEIEYRGKKYLIGKKEFSDISDSSIVYLLTKELNLFFLQGVRVECTESEYFYLGTYFGEVVIWGFFGWVKLFDEEDVIRWSESLE